jgi:Ca2+-binding EF-hand superfamily protein
MTHYLILAAVLALAPGSAAAQQPKTHAQIEAEREQSWFLSMDKDADGVITRQEWRGNARMFARHDLNRDGVLSGTELWINGRRPEQRPYTEEDQRRDELLETFYRADVNDDGRIGRREWWSDRQTFSRVDRNRDGFISEEEYLGDENARQTATPSPQDRQASTTAYKSGYERGLAEGRQAGKEDKERRNQWDLEGQRELEQADSGYSAQLGAREDYQAGYRAGFRLGYKQGFGPRHP